MPEMMTYIVCTFDVNLNLLQFVNVLGILRLSNNNDSRTLCIHNAHH